MNIKNKIFLGIVTILITSCAAVPKQVVDAVQKQKTEIANIKLVYFKNLMNQLETIEKYEYMFIDLYEKQIIQKYTHAPNVTNNQFKNGAPTGDKNIDFINMAHLEEIQNTFNKLRNDVKKDIEKRKENINLLNKNFENIEQLNNAVDEYMQSLIHVKEAQDKLAQSIKSKLEKLIPIPINFENLPDQNTIEEVINNLKK